MDGAALVGGDGKQGLGDHAAQDVAGQLHRVLILHQRQIREILGIGAHDVEFAHAALDVDHVILCGNTDHIVGKAADNVAEQVGAQHQGARLGHVGGDDGADTCGKVVAGQPQLVCGVDQNALQSGDGAFRADRTGGNGDGALKERFFAGEFHG